MAGSRGSHLSGKSGLGTAIHQKKAGSLQCIPVRASPALCTLLPFMALHHCQKEKACVQSGSKAHEKAFRVSLPASSSPNQLHSLMRAGVDTVPAQNAGQTRASLAYSVHVQGSVTTNPGAGTTLCAGFCYAHAPGSNFASHAGEKSQRAEKSAVACLAISAAPEEGTGKQEQAQKESAGHGER